MREPIYLVAEAGSNWRHASGDDRETAFALIDAAAQSGVDAVKFQLFRAHLTYAPSAGPCPHLAARGIKEDISLVFKELELADEIVPLLAERCHQRSVAFMASFFSPRDFAVVDPHVRMHKIASPELHDPELLRLAGGSAKPILLSTGISTFDEIAWALDQLSRAGASDVTLLHCTVQYPAEPEGVHIRRMVQLREQFGRAVGLSDHSRDPCVAPVAAVASGAVLIEKHFTLDNSHVGPDHNWALTPCELASMVRSVRLCEQMLGTAYEGISPQEEPLRRFSRRSVQAIRAICKGEPLLTGINIAILRPGNQVQGVHPSLLEQLQGRLARRDIELGEGIQWEDWNESLTTRF